MAPVRATTTGAVIAAGTISISMAVLSYFICAQNRCKKKEEKKGQRNGLVDAIGNTPLIRINSLSEATGCEVYSLHFCCLEVIFRLVLVFGSRLNFVFFFGVTGSVLFFFKKKL